MLLGHLGAGLHHLQRGDENRKKLNQCHVVPAVTKQICPFSQLAEVWEKEFDPIMVVLRTVYRRDVQSAMDRYSAL